MTDFFSITSNFPPTNVFTDDPKNPVKPVPTGRSQDERVDDMYDLDIIIKEHPLEIQNDASSGSRCMCDTAGCVLTQSCQSRCGGTQCMC